MSKCLSRYQYYNNKDLRNLFPKLEIEEEEVISHEFDDILKLVERRFRKLSLKYHPDKEEDNDKKKEATKKFQDFNNDKKKLDEYLNVLKAGETLSNHRELSQKGKKEKQRKTLEILSCRDEAIKGAMICFVLANIVLLITN